MQETPPSTAPSVSLGTDPSFSRPTTTTTQGSGGLPPGSKPTTSSATSSSGLGLTGVSAPSTANSSSSNASNRQPGGYRVLDDGRILSYNIRYYRDGSVYEGEFLGNKRHGLGTLVEKSVGKYEGEFKDNVFDGYGVYLWFPPVLSEVERLRKKEMPSEKRYEGQWVAGKKDGFGHYKMEDGSEYQGNFKKNRFHGFGKLTTKAGDSYEGEWVRNKLDGEGKIMYASGDVYTGEMLDGRFDGKGHFEYRPVMPGASSMRPYYRGEFHRGYRHGRGTRVFADGSKYDGRWSHNEMQGHGIMVFGNGKQYIGEWKGGLPHGQGVLIMKHGDKYEGSFHRGVPYGRGRYSYADGGVYDGEYLATQGGYEHGVRFPQADGLRCGHGKRTWVSSNAYKGMWADNMMEGEGLLTKGAGGSYQGTWREDRRQGQGKESWGNRTGTNYTCPLGHAHPGKGYCTYEGGFERDLMHGKGRLVCMDGRSYEGLWRQGKRHGYGTQVLIPTEHRGNAKRQFVGGVGGMYRPVKYEGEWVDGQRTGRGYNEYANGLQVHGQFEAGRLGGVCTTIYPPATTAKGRPAPPEQRQKRLGMFERGTRVMWISPIFTDAEDTIRDPNPRMDPPPELRPPPAKQKGGGQEEGEDQ